MENRLKELIAKMVLKSNYWGYLFSRIRRLPNEQLPSIMGVAPQPDGTITLFYHPKLIDESSDETINIVLEHEGMHLLNKHIPRLLRILADEMNNKKKLVKSMVWNIAADCCVNEQAHLPQKIQLAGHELQLCHPEIYDLPPDKAAEFYYHRLLKKQEDQQKKCKNGECGCDKGESGEGKGCGCGNAITGDEYDHMDDHGDWSKSVEGVADQSSLSRKIENFLGDIVKESAKNINKSRGYVPGHIQELIDALLKPPFVPYYMIIKKLVRGSRLSKFKRSSTKINRKRTYVFTLTENNLPQISPFPGRTRDFTFKIAILIDTSGSMSKEEILEGLSGVKHIIEKDRHSKVTVIENDTQVQKEYVVKRVKDIQMQVAGRGGTTLRPGLERCRELNVDIALIFTDGGCDDINAIPRKFLPKKMIWVISPQGETGMIDKSGYVIKIPS